MIILGLNSGTSRDGVSAAIFETLSLLPKAKVRLILHRDYPYPAWAQRQLDGLEQSVALPDLAYANFMLGELFAEAALKLIRESGVKRTSIHLIASHGQTVGHFPKRKKIGGFNLRATLQIGEPSVIALRTGVTTVSDFRPADVSAGGQGAPVLAYPEWLLFASQTAGRMALNLGGIANFSLLPKAQGPEQVRATDAGPCNLLLDGLAARVSKGRQKFDQGGRIALSGRPQVKWVKAFLRHEFFSRPAPKTCGREEFGPKWIDGLLRRIRFSPGAGPADLMRSAACAVAQMVAQCLAQNYPAAVDEVVVSGGGAKNRALVLELEKSLGKKIILSDKLGVPVQGKEPIGFGLLGELCLRGVKGNLPGATGAESRVVLGKITPGENWRELPAIIKIVKGGDW